MASSIVSMFVILPQDCSQFSMVCIAVFNGVLRFMAGFHQCLDRLHRVCKCVCEYSI